LSNPIGRIAKINARIDKIATSFLLFNFDIKTNKNIKSTRGAKTGLERHPISEMRKAEVNLITCLKLGIAFTPTSSPKDRVSIASSVESLQS
jgi:hypothetical protein